MHGIPLVMVIDPEWSWGLNWSSQESGELVFHARQRGFTLSFSLGMTGRVSLHWLLEAVLERE